MWLLNTSTICRKAFAEGSIPPYAILSHTRTDDEATFDDVRTTKNVIEDGQHEFKITNEEKLGWRKIRACCKKALTEGFGWVWIDTCCIDQKSSAELSEAINSMWRYYKVAKVCYAYLSDVPPLGILETNELREYWKTAFGISRWFTRGWTLQELLAPHHLVFLAQDWSTIGFKSELSEKLTAITGIEEDFLNSNLVRSASLAERLSWASRRSTTRIEDMAYCLLGILDVNMPLLYGEDCPADFQTVDDVSSFFHKEVCTPFTVTNAGIRLRSQMGPPPPAHEVGLPPSEYNLHKYEVLALVHYRRGFGDGKRTTLGILIEWLNAVSEEGDDRGIAWRARRAFPWYIYIRRNMHIPSPWPRRTVYLQYQ